MGLVLSRVAAGLFGVLCAVFAFKRPDIGWLPFHLAFGAMMGAIALLAFWFAALGHRAEDRTRVTIMLMAGLFLGMNGAVEGTVMWMIVAQETHRPLVLAITLGPAFFVLGVLLAFAWIATRRASRPTSPQTA